MSNTGLRQFDRTIQTTTQWLNDVMEAMGTDDRNKAYLAFRSVLQTLRDRLTVEEATDLGAQLPMLVRGFYYEGWNPAQTPTTQRDVNEFLDRIAEYYPLDADIDPREAVRVTFQVLEKHITPGELEDVKAMLPPELRDVWSEAAAEVR